VNSKIWVFSGRSNPEFTSAICKNIGCELGRIESTRFSDGELSIELCENVRGGDIFVVQSTSTPGNDNLMELLITIDALKRASAWRITAVVPYFGYARQDRKLKPRVPITAKLVADLLTTAGAGRLLTMDLHSGQIMGFFNIPVDNLEALPVLVNYISAKYGVAKEITIVSPDAGGVERARRYATKLGNSAIAVIDKRRSAPNQVDEMNVIGDVKGKVCVIVDDMVDTATTLVKAVDKLLEAGANKVIAAIAHGVLSGVAVEKLKDSPIEELIITDSIYLPPSKRIEKIKVLSVAPFFAEAIGRIHRNDSVSSLFI
jgi:ribose-phosphate pyrophosphokinase